MISHLALFTWLVVVPHSKGQSCNLLNSDKSGYVDYSTFSAIDDLCDQGYDSLSKWEQYQCNARNGRNETCWPRRYFSNCKAGNLRGIAFLYHGYSACPDQYMAQRKLLQNECYHVYLPTTIGHGLKYCDTNDTSNGCYGGEYNLTQLPTSRSKYLQFIDEMNEIMSDELNIVSNCEYIANNSWNSSSNTNSFDKLIGGLSFGSALSTTTVYRSYMYDIKWTKQVLMSPFLGISYSGVDDIIYKCGLNGGTLQSCFSYYYDSIGYDFDFVNGTSDVLANLTYQLLNNFIDIDYIDTSYETLNLLIRNIITYMVETNDTFVTENSEIQELLDYTIGWGYKCETDQHSYGRGGFCSFTVRHLAASHSVGSYILDNVENSENVNRDIDTLYIMVERDGQVRNSLVAQYSQLMFKNNENKMSKRARGCMWLISAECQMDESREIDNTCGVPHACTSIKDNIILDPYYLWWNITYNDGITAFAVATQNETRSNMINFPSKFMTDTWNGDKDECVTIDMYDPPAELIADVPQNTKFIISLKDTTLTDDIENAILDEISDVLGVDRGILELTSQFTQNNDNQITIDCYLTTNSAKKLATLMSYEAIDDINDYDLSYVYVSGESYNVSSSANDSSNKSSNDNEITSLIVWICVAVGIVIICGVSFAFARKKYRQQRPMPASDYQAMS